MFRAWKKLASKFEQWFKVRLTKNLVISRFSFGWRNFKKNQEFGSVFREEFGASMFEVQKYVYYIHGVHFQD